MVMLQFSGGRHTSGYVVSDDYEGHREEGETYSCCHCQKICIIKPGSGIRRGWCFRCNKPLCGKQQCLDRCEPWEAKIEAMEARGRLFAALDRERELTRRDAERERIKQGR